MSEVMELPWIQLGIILIPLWAWLFIGVFKILCKHNLL